jgi:extracellular elastinolytic metalloproteinase
MPRNIDTRDFTFTRPTANFVAAAEAISMALPGSHTVSADRINPFTGSAESLNSVNAAEAFSPVAGLGPAKEDLVARALEHVQAAASVLGFSGPDEQVEFVPDPHVKRTTTGESVVNLRQQYRGVPVFQMERTVLFDQNGAIQAVTGDSVGLSSDLDTLPAVTVESAAAAAARYVAQGDARRDAWTKQVIQEPSVDLDDYAPRILGRIPLPSQPCVLDKGPFGDYITANLVFLYQGPTTRLGWHMVFTLPDFVAQYVVIVEADAQTADPENPQVIYSQNVSHNMADGGSGVAEGVATTQVRGSVWTHNPGMNPTRRVVSFPRTLAELLVQPVPPNLPDGFPLSWITGDMTTGNNTVAVLGDTTQSFRGLSNNGTITFEPSEPQGDDQKVLNIFYFCNFMHDFFYLLGFDEVANFQQSNVTGKGRGGDPVIAHAHSGAVFGTANMVTRADGQQGQMNMGLVTGSGRHTAFDSDVVFHEFTHGVSNRLVGGMGDALALQQTQSRSMGEGWSDYFALTVQNFELQNERTITGDWVLDDPAGIRMHPYDDNYPGTFGQVGQSPYDEVHNIGEIWCAALMKINRDLGTAFGNKKRGHLLGWQLVVDGMKMTRANPSFLDARDGILRALEGQRKAGKLSTDDHQRALRVLWRAFARFGMGPKARSVGASLVGIVEDRNPPAGI